MPLLNDLNEKLIQLDKNRRYIDESLKDYGLRRISDSKFSVSHVNRVDDAELTRAFNSYIIKISSVTHDLHHIIANGEAEDTREIEKFDEMKKHERIHYWTLWVHRSLRWITGSTIAIVFYSILVAASESESGYLNWVKIPVREWIARQTL